MLEWVKIFDSMEEARERVPLNTVVPVTIGPHEVCLGHLSDGFYAIDDRCPHQQASLGMGECKQQSLVECPFHHYLFDLRTGKNVGETAYDVPRYPVKSGEDGLFIGVK